jgi:hypothetical protein
MAERILQLLPTPDAARRARAYLRRGLHGVLSGTALADATLLASELVVARIVAGGSRPDRRISVVLRCDRDVVCRVSDDAREPSAGDPWWPADGHGADRLRLLDALSADWGVELGPPFTVWFAMRRPGGDDPETG